MVRLGPETEASRGLGDALIVSSRPVALAELGPPLRCSSASILLDTISAYSSKWLSNPPGVRISRTRTGSLAAVRRPCFFRRESSRRYCGRWVIPTSSTMSTNCRGARTSRSITPTLLRHSYGDTSCGPSPGGSAPASMRDKDASCDTSTGPSPSGSGPVWIHKTVRSIIGAAGLNPGGS
jgi:hypothetical protein